MNQKLIIANGVVCAGDGSAPLPQDVLLENDTIAALGKPGEFDDAEAERVDAAGKWVVPGFIDAHSHGDTRKMCYPDNRSKLLQGVTTEVDGNCGSSASCVPGKASGLQWNCLTEYIDCLKKAPASTNTVVICGHNSIRRHVMANSDRQATPEEIKAMQGMLANALELGAAGWSSGLTYFPGKFADTSELLALSQVTRGSQRIYTTHLRSEGDTLLEALHEAFSIAEAGSCRLEVSHLKTIFPRNFHKLGELLATLNTKREAGLDIHADRYPYIYSSTRLGQALPPPYDKIVDIRTRLQESADYQEEIVEALKHSPRDLPTTIVMKARRTLLQLAEADGVTVERKCMELLKEDDNMSSAYLCMSEENMMRVLAQPWVCAGSDGISAQLDNPSGLGHPRAVGTFPRFYRMVSGLCGKVEAIRRMTSLPATIFNIPRRGLVKAGYVADLVIMDPEKLDSLAGYGGENLMPIGIERVMVAGKTAWSAQTPEKVGRHGTYLAIDK